MNIKTFISSVLSIDSRCNTIIKELENIDKEKKVSILNKQINSNFINYCNVYIPYLLKQETKSDKDIANILYNDTAYN